MWNVIQMVNGSVFQICTSILICILLVACGGESEKGNEEDRTSAPEGPSIKAVADEYSVDVGQTLTMALIVNDTIPDRTEVTLTFPNDPGLEKDGLQVKYVGDVLVPIKEFVYTITDESGNSDSAKVTITLNHDQAENGRIITHSDKAITTQGKAILIDVLANDISDQAGALIIDDTGQNQVGATVSIEENKLRFVPNEHFTGVYRFFYSVSGEFGTSVTGVEVEVLVEPVIEGRYVESQLSSLRKFSLPHLGLAISHDYLSTQPVTVEGLGDFNGDGLDDIAACYPHLDVQSSSVLLEKAGECYVVLGHALDTASQLTMQALLESKKAIRIHAETSGTELGVQLSAVGDFNNDGFADILISSIYEDVRIRKIVLGRESIEAIRVAKRAESVNSIITLEAEPGTLSILPIGDINGDGFADLASLVRLGDGAAGQFDEKKIAIILGHENPEVSLPLSNSDFELISGIEDAELKVAAINRGQGDLNADGFEDFVIEVKGSHKRVGGLIFFGRDLDVQASKVLDLTDGIFLYAEDSDKALRFGDIGDYTGDGQNNIVVSVGEDNETDLYLYTLSGLEQGDSLKLNDEQSPLVNFRNAKNYHNAISLQKVGDINDDGIQDIAIHNVAFLPSQSNLSFIYGNPLFEESIDLSELLLSKGGNGKLGATIREEPDASIYFYSAPAGDFNGDGFADYVVAGAANKGQVQLSIIWGAEHWGDDL